MSSPIESLEITQPVEQAQQLIEMRNAIIESVFTRGLLPGTRLRRSRKDYFGSADSKHNEHVWGYTLHPYSHYKYYHYENADAELSRDINSALYQRDWSVLPVMMERRDEETFWAHPAKPKRRMPVLDIPLLERRIGSCFLVVAEYDFDTLGGQMRSSVGPDSIRNYIFSQRIWDEYQKVEGKNPSVPVLTTSVSIERQILGQDAYKSMRVPDFETPVLEILNEPDLQAGVWISGVRLPIADDLAT